MKININTNISLSHLNPEQLRAVTYPAESVLVLAGAGSGKTQVLTTRIAWLLSTSQASVHSIMAVTFTNKAAKEMSARIGAMLPISTSQMWLGTFHGLCHRFLRIHAKEASLVSTFQIIDQGDQLALIKRLFKEWNFNQNNLSPKDVQGFINAQKEAGLRPDDIQAIDNYSRKLVECYAGYEKVCRQEHLVDFAELMLRCYEVLRDNQPLREHYQQRFNHILVDEFQDTNQLQYRWLRLISGEKTAVFAVGDDDQSIYRFRGANVGNMDEFQRDFHVESIIKLEQNYRSHGHILTAANILIAHNEKRLGKNLRTDAPKGELLRWFQANDDIDEARFVVDEIKSLLKEGVSTDDIAVLYRSNAQSRVLEQVLFSASIPYKIYGGLRFYERQEIKHALAYLRLAVNPDDEQAFLRIINMPPRGIGTRTIENIQSVANAQNCSLFQATLDMAQLSSKLGQFIQLIHELQSYIGVSSLKDTVEFAVKNTGLMQYYANQKGEHQERIENLNELIHAGQLFRQEEILSEMLPEDTSDNPLVRELIAFLSNAVLEAGERSSQDKNTPAVQLMTVHSAKGLEFGSVFLTGLEEGVFPNDLARQEYYGLEEERRLMYVAITRAKARLYLSMAQYRMLHGKPSYQIPSSFISEIPSDLIQSLSGSVSHCQSSTQQNNQVEDNTLQDFAGFHIGDNIRHPKFGTGVIIDATNLKTSTRFKINFGKEGIKELDSTFAKLEKI